MTLLSDEVWDLTSQHMQGKCAPQHSSPPKAPYKPYRSRMIKRKARTFKYALVRNHLQIWVTWANHSRNKSYLYVFKIMQKPKFLSMNNVRRFESKLFHFSITQNILVDTWKFTSYGEAWNNLYIDCKSRRWTRLVLKTLLMDEQRTKCGGACWWCLILNLTANI